MADKTEGVLAADRLRELLSYDPETGVFVWNVSRGTVKKGAVAGRKNTDGYIEISIDSRLYKAHRHAWLYVYGVRPTSQLDHRYGIRDDNRIGELREATNAQNQQNRSIHPKNTSRHPGVSSHKATGKWRAQIQISKRRVHLGLFDDVGDAETAYADAKSKLHPFQPTVRAMRGEPPVG